MRRPVLTRGLPPAPIILTVDQKKILRKVRTWVQNFYLNAEKNGLEIAGGHGFDHSERVAGMSAILAGMENQDPFLPILVAIIHDVGRASKDARSKTWQHGELSKEMASELLNSLNLSQKDRTSVDNALDDHPKLNNKVRLNYIVKIVMDADRLDTFGALAPVRAAAHRWKLPLYSLQMRKVNDQNEYTTIFHDFAFRSVEFYDMLWTNSAKRIALPRLQFLKAFIAEYEEETMLAHQSFANLGI